jgi:predicted RNA-binding Zn-ribbon protein involved in translation (DUF1610 family)
MWTFLQILFWILVALPLLIMALALVGATLGHFSLQKSIRIAAHSPCPNCGEVIGREAVLAAFGRKAQAVHDVIKLYLRPRVRPEWSIECPHCGVILQFHPNENRFEAPPAAADAAKI